jgi:hypothetical protein
VANEEELARAVATAVLGLDTLWGGDVMNPSGAGRFIADSWFSDEPLPPAYTHPAARRLREGGGISAKAPDGAAVDAYLTAVDVPGAIAAVAAAARAEGSRRGGYLDGLAESLDVMWALGLELLGRGPRVSYERCVMASTGRAPEPSQPDEKRERLAELLCAAGHDVRGPEALLAAVDAWRRARLVPAKSLQSLARAFIAQLEAGTARHVVPHLPSELHAIPRANVTFLPLADAFFSGSMNYLGHDRMPDGAPRYEATYEVNASLELAIPELANLVAHEVVPGHVTTFALLHALHARGRLGFEGSVLTLNTRFATLSEGIANHAILLAYGVNDVLELPDPELRIGTLLALLQDDAKNQCSWLTWQEEGPEAEVAAAIRRDCLVSAERAGKLAGGWGRHPLSGRMGLPAYRAGTEKVAALRRAHPPERVLPALFGAKGLVDIVTIDEAIAG